MTTHPTVRAYEAWWQMYRRTWRGSAATSFLSPVLYMAAMGWGLGRYVSSGGGQARLGGYDYLTYLAPGLLAATAMQIGVGESTWPVLGSIKWWRRYHAMLATPLRVRDVMLGHVGWMLTRVATTSAVFFAVMAAFGTVPHGYSALALPAAILTGMAFAVPVAAFSATQETDVGFSTLFRFMVMPMPTENRKNTGSKNPVTMIIHCLRVAIRLRSMSRWARPPRRTGGATRATRVLLTPALPSDL